MRRIASGTLIYDSLRKCHQMLRVGVLLKVLGTFEKRATGHKWKRYHSFFERFLCQSLWNYMMLLNGELQVIQSKCWRLQIVTDNIVASLFNLENLQEICFIFHRNRKQSERVLMFHSVSLQARKCKKKAKVAKDTEADTRCKRTK